MTEPRPFGLMLRRPGSDDVFVGPTFTEPDAVDECDFYPGYGDRGDKATDWEVSLPHRCDEWLVASGPLEHVLAEARRFRAELDAAITTMEGSRDE